MRGFGSAMITLVLLCFLTFFSSIGVSGWEAIVYATPGSTVTSDSPLPLALSHIVGKNSPLYHLLITIGLFGLIASFHGIILAAGRVTFEFGRVGYFPRVFGKAHPKLQTPMWALLANMVAGIVALLTGKTGEIITIACFGALALYILSLVTFFKLRKDSPKTHRPFVAPFYPWAQVLALVIAVVAFLSMIYFNFTLALIYFGLMLLGFIWFKLTVTEDERRRVLMEQESS
jgi:ethanolamine permease